MRYEYIEPVVNSTMSVLDEVLQTDISKGNVSLIREGSGYGEFNIVVNLSGDTDGSIFLNMEMDTALNICAAMSGSECESLGPSGMDCLLELANMVAGNVTSMFNDMGLDYKVSMPKTVSRDDITTRLPNLEVFQVPLFTEFGEVTVNVTVSTN